MNSALIVMAILGCADGGGQCQTVRTVETPYASVAACNAAAGPVLERLTDLEYPTLMAQCQRSARRGDVAEASPPLLPR
ncbi:MAG: hypothetical protein INF91_02825 [Alphaproteobacteria bacterium]|nr:hypothetical protein [Alphaproteobacteria bacterium]